MLVFISCAKTMTVQAAAVTPVCTEPVFSRQALENALAMSRFSVEELEGLLSVNPKTAALNRARYLDFSLESPDRLPAVLAYTGVVFKHLDPARFSQEDFLFAQRHLLITSFLYGLLRPLDLIGNYRMEGDVRLYGGMTMFDYWKPLLTDYFIGRVKEEGGVLFNLASGEMKRLFDWKRVETEVRVVTPEFQVWKKGRPTNVTVYAKMCRGEMARRLVLDRIDRPEDLKSFCWEGFRFDAGASTEDRYFFRSEA